jgi:hypothetical protein
MKELKLNLSKTAAFEICKTALLSCDIGIEEECPDRNFIRGSTDLSFLSFGNKIEITLTESARLTSITVHSKSSASLQLIDWGKNTEIEENIAKRILQSCDT